MQLLCYLPRVVLYPSPTQRPKPPILSPDLVLLNRRIIVFVLTFSQVVAYRCAVSIKNSEGEVKMKSAVASPVITGPHKPLVAGSSPVAATTKHKSSFTDQGTSRNPQSYLASSIDQGIPLRQAVDSFLLSCKVEGKS